MQITFLQDYNGIEAGRTFTSDPAALDSTRWTNVTDDGTHQFLSFDANKLHEQGIVAIEYSVTGITTATGTTMNSVSQ